VLLPCKQFERAVENRRWLLSVHCVAGASWWVSTCHRKQRSYAVGNISTTDARCSYTAFWSTASTVRMKGTWVHDPSLVGFRVLCRRSQVKYNVPMKCLVPTIEVVDPMYETMDVSRFCKKSITGLNVRVIQVCATVACTHCARAREHQRLTCFDRSLSITQKKPKRLLRCKN
jgi:hypothetical protein